MHNLFSFSAGAEAKKLFEEAQVMLKKMRNDKLLQAHDVVGLYRAHCHGDDIHYYGGHQVNRQIAKLKRSPNFPILR